MYSVSVISMVEKSFKRSQDNASHTIALWRLVYAFIEEKEYSKEEKTRGKNWEITQAHNLCLCWSLYKEN